ncbi:receptor-like protein 6 [Vitis riparia]|uniref:receptor-like protein 6 n=1 Tax=Vitis riparia TaxID=96939 RepID=UPI00155B383E|nr:receptor-like protein 6 [Vitis riparia]
MRMLVMILLLIRQKLQCGNPMEKEKEKEKKVIAARGMVLSVTGRLVISSAFTLPEVVSMLSRLRSLDLSFSRFSGQIPSELLALSKLVFLDLSGNPMLQLQKPGLRNMETSPLEMLHLAGTSFSGELPTSIWRLGSLTNLDISSCNFQLLDNGLSLLSYTKFKFLELDACNLTKIPDFLQKQDELKLLSLSNNKIHGPIPKWIWNISKETLEYLDLSGNFLIGFDQPPVVLPWSKLKSLNLDSNMLQGPLPIPPPSTSEYLVFGNKLIGEISPLICNMSSLMLLDLSSNNLSGRIPQCLANFNKSLFVLDLGNNRLDGPIPQTCTMPNNLRVIDLGENQFQGQIPRSFANCMMLEHLVLGNNQIDDIFPFWLGALPQLQVLILRSNRFHTQGASFAEPWWQQSYWPYPILPGKPNTTGVIGSFPKQALRQDPLATNKDDIP